MKALVVFLDKSERRTAWLKRGFRHVLVAVEVAEGTVVVVDAAGGGLHLWAGGCELKDVARHYFKLDAVIVETEAEPGGSLYPTRWTCVEVVKRVLGVRGLFVLTPHQLFRRLTCETG